MMRGNYRVGRAEVKDGTTSRLVEEDYAQEVTIYRQPTVVIDKAKLPELLHEMTDPRPGCADHLYQVFLIDFGEANLDSTFLTQMREQEENPSWALLAGIEKPIDEILPNALDACPGPFHILSLDLQLQRF
jgi:hypothetical protein